MTLKNSYIAVILPNFLVWKICGSPLFQQNYSPNLCVNCTFPQNFGTRKLRKVLVFYTVKYTSAANTRQGFSIKVSFLSDIEKSSGNSAYVHIYEKAMKQLRNLNKFLMQ